MSLTTWFRDYVYIPLGGSRGSLFEKIRNTFIIFLLSGFWHGANWTFIVWGTLNAIYFLPSLISGKNRKNLDVPAEGNRLPSFKEAVSILSTFMLTVFAWIFFRAENMTQALSYIKGMFSEDLFSIPNFNHLEGAVTLLVLIAVFILVEWKGREGQYAISNLGIKRSRIFRWAMYLLLILIIDIFGNTSEEIEFIYFQF
jgi:D-alanyl-lipoteichoic acid acyltransferase DltB (MBOAT superfamily)